MILNSTKVAKSLEIVEEKKRLWLTQFPSLQFDEYGRCLIYEGVNKRTSYLNYFKGEVITLSPTFLLAFNTYLLNQKLLIENADGCFVDQLSSKNDISFEVVVSNLVRVKREGKHILDMKLTKILSKVHEIWVQQTSLNELNQTLNTLVKKTVEYNRLKFKILFLMKNNLYLDIQNVSNKQEQKPLYLTLNPLDFLTSSGEGNSDSDCYTSIGSRNVNPTKYFSCIGLNIEQVMGGLQVTSGGMYSNPMTQLVLGSLKNSALLVQLNGNTLPVPNTTFSLLGYSLRIRTWLDVESIYLERHYPTTITIPSDFPLRIQPKQLGRISPIQDVLGVKQLSGHLENSRGETYFDYIELLENNTIRFI